MTAIDFEKLGCFGRARLVLGEKLGARIYEVHTPIEDEEDVVHAYVLCGDQVLNQDGEMLSKDEILKRGRDVTKRILNTPWERL